MARIFVGMSGGVDSSTAAALLVDAGHDVVGITLALLPDDAAPPDDPAEGCCDATSARRARTAADALGIPHYTWNAREAFREGVLVPFAQAYANGETPNPCTVCNDLIKFGWLLDRAVATGADTLATGHYARVVTAADGGLRIARGVDTTRDQSYFLYRMGPERLGRVMFPLGELMKDEVRAIARERGLPAADAPESRETCFAPDGDYARVVAAECPQGLLPGDIVTMDGRVLGRHDGIARYTVGQRKGLSLPDGPWFVVSLDPESQRVVVGLEQDLAVSHIRARDTVSYATSEDLGAAAGLTVQLRYRSRPLPARVSVGDVTHGRPDLVIELTAEPATGVAAGQAAVVYEGPTVLAGGVVSR